MRIGIVGAGAIGTLFGYKLAVQNDVTLFEIRRDIVDAVNRDGLRLDDGEPRAVKASADARDLYNVDALFVFVRATDTLRALRPFAGKLNPSSAVVSLQNGVGNEEAIKTALGGHLALVLGATTESSLVLGPGRARAVGTGQ
ncbi:MAG: ketopantoate reductase family protein, partial [Candidatus Velthaea sp.]